MELAQNRVQYGTLVLTALNLGVRKNSVNYS
jgi:hypothetical protein